MVVGDSLRMRLETGNKGRSCQRQIVAVECCDRGRVRWIPKNRMNIGRSFVENSGRRSSVKLTGGVGEGESTGKVSVHRVGRVANAIGSDGDFVLIVANSVSAAEYQLVFEFRRRPRESNHRAEVAFLRGVEIATHANIQICQRVRARSELHYVLVVLLGVQRSEVRPPQSQVDGEIRTEFEVILHKHAPKFFPVVLAIGERYAGLGIELA